MLSITEHRRSKSYKKSCIFKTVERDRTYKGYHLQVSEVVKTENLEECWPILLRHVPRTGTLLMLDGCGIGNALLITDKYNVDQCNHKDNLYVKPGSELEDVNFKVTNNLSENLHKEFRKDMTVGFGIKAYGSSSTNISNLIRYCNRSDWIHNFTNKEPSDCLHQFVTHLSKFWGCSG